MMNMTKPFYAVIAAAAAAAIVTFATAPEAVTAGPLPIAEAAAIKTCAERPWPYLRCVGTHYGKKNIRLVTTDRLG